MSGFGEHYASTRERITRFVSKLGEDALNRVAPATPAWDVHGLVSHVTGVAADMVSGNLAEVGQPSWTQAQVDARRQRSLEELIGEWNQLSPQVEEALKVMHPAMAGLTLADLVTHEHDIRGAVDDAGARDTDALRVATDTYVRTAGRALKATDLPGIVVEVEDQTWTIGKGEPQQRLRAPRFELFRTIAGRRSREQARAFEWDGDPDPYLEHLSLFGYRAEPLTE